MRKKGNQIGNIVHESVPVSNTEVCPRPQPLPAPGRASS